MVAEFRLDIPNMSYVNVTPQNSSTDDNGQRISPTRGSILKNCDSDLLTEMMNSHPDLCRIILGGQLSANNDGDHNYQYGTNGNQYSSNNNFPGSSRGGSGSSSGTQRTQSVNGQQSLQSYPSSPSFMPYGNNNQSDELTRSYSAHDGRQNQRSMARRHLAPSVRKQSQSIYQSPSSVTVIRSTSTLEVSTSSPSCLYGGPSVSGGLSGTHHQTPSPALGVNGQSNCLQSLTRSGSDSVEAVVAKLIMDQENLIRENQNLKRENLSQKRKLQDLAVTISNPEKLQKVLQALEQRRRNGQ